MLLSKHVAFSELLNRVRMHWNVPAWSIECPRMDWSSSLWYVDEGPLEDISTELMQHFSSVFPFMLSSSYWSQSWPILGSISRHTEMGDPLSIASGVIGILTLALNASKKLYELSQSIQGHPREVESMRDEFKMLSSILKQLQQKSTKALSSKDELLEALLKGCFDCCDELNKSLKGLGSPGVRDWLRLQFRGRVIEDLKARLLSYKSYLSIALQVIEL